MVMTMKVLRYEITDACNLRCKMCWSTDWQHKDMGLYGAKKLIDEFADLYPGQMVILTSREPLASCIFEDIVRYLHAKRLKIGILTNGTLLTERIYRCLCSSEISAISVSLHGEERYHDYTVGVQGAARKTIDALKKISDMKAMNNDLCLRITNVISPGTMSALDYLIDLAKRNSAVLRLQHLMWHSEKRKTIHKQYLKDKYNIIDNSIDGFPSNPTITADEVINIVQTAEKKCLQNNIKLEIYPLLTEDQIYRWYNSDGDVFYKANCGHAFDSIRIRADGSVVYCQYIEHMYGDINKSGLINILNDDGYIQWAKDMKNGYLTPLCQRCCHVCPVGEEDEYMI